MIPAGVLVGGGQGGCDIKPERSTGSDQSCENNDPQKTVTRTETILRLAEGLQGKD